MKNVLLAIMVSTMLTACSSIATGKATEADILALAKKAIKKRDGWSDQRTRYVIDRTSDGGWCVDTQRRDPDQLEIDTDSHRMILFTDKGKLVCYIKL